jgi:flagellar export protein FliJ
MPFQFPLAAVLKYRESIERMEYLALETIQLEIARTEAHISQVDDWRRLASEHRAAELARGVASIHVQGAYEHELALERYRDLLQNTLKELRKNLQQHLKTYEVAHQKREILDQLRGRQLDSYNRSQAKRQQSILDDLFLARRNRGK